MTPRATMSTRVLETIDIITAILLHAGLAEHQLGQAAGLRDGGVAADLAVVGGPARRARGRRRTASASRRRRRSRGRGCRRTRSRCRPRRGGRSRRPPRPRARTAVASRAWRVSSSPTPSSASSLRWRPRASFSMSMCASSATNEPSARRPSGLISASIMSFSTNSRARRVTIGTSLLSAEPVTPVEAITSLAWKSLNGQDVREVPRARPSRAAPRRPARCRCRRRARRSSRAACAMPSQTTPA